MKRTSKGRSASKVLERLPDFTERKIEGSSIYEGRIISVYSDKVRLPDGNIAQREVVRHPGAVVILPMLDSGRILMVWQYRYPIGTHSLELPAGKREKGEQPESTARRELLEETGYKAEQMERAFVMHSSVGFCDEELDLFVATGLSQVGREVEEGEFVHTCELDVEEGIALVREGRISDSKTMVGLMWAREIACGNCC